MPAAGSRFRCYLIAVACVSAALLFRLGLNPALGTAFPYITFIPAILLGAWYGGMGPGLLATLLSALAARYIAMSPLHSLAVTTWADGVGLGLFLATGVMISWLNDTLHKSQRIGARQRQKLQEEIHEREQAEADLRESKQRTEELLASISDAVLGIDRDWRYTYVNDQAARLLKRRSEELLGNIVWDVFPDAVGSESYRRMHEAMERKTIQRWHDYYAPLGLWDDVAAYPAKDGITVYIRDITDQKAAADARRDSEERLQVALDAASEGLWDWNIVKGTSYYGPRYSTILGYEPGELPPFHQTWLDLVHPDDLPGILRRPLTPSRVANVPIRVEYRIRKKSGEYIWVQSISKVMTWSEDGKAVRMVGTITDITERKALEAQFQQAQRLESVGRLAGGVAHDFNNLLTVINGYAAMVLQDLPAENPLREGIEEIYSAGERAANLTQQLLAFSRKQLLQPSVLNINQVVLEVDKMLRRLIGEDIQLVMSLAPEIGNITADVGQLQQVLINLAVNSRDALPDGGTLIIETKDITFDEEYVMQHPEVRQGSHVMLAVTDDGVGMTPEVRDRLFEPFFTTKAQGAGTGLGLATVYGIVRQSGGWIWVCSELGRGTTFKLYFPRTDEQPAPVTAVPKPDVRGTETILVVEDQADVRQMSVTALQRYGYQVYSAGNAEEALEFCAGFAGRIDLLLTDVVMPGKNGRELADRLSRERQEMRVIFMSGYTEDAIAHHQVLEQGVAYLQKPFTPDRLAAMVREVFELVRPDTTILLVDDDDTVRRLLRTMLVTAGYVVLEAGDGRAALRSVAEHPEISLVITDLVMPDQEGLETIRKLHASDPHIKMLAISGAFRGDLLTAAIRFGAHGTLRKPIHREDLLREVENILKAGPGRS